MRGHPTNFGFDPTLVIAKLLNHPKCGELAFVQFGIHGGPGPSSWIAVDTLRRNLVELVGHEAPRDVVAEDPLRMGTCDAFATPMGDQLSNFIRKSLVESGEPR